MFINVPIDMFWLELGNGSNDNPLMVSSPGLYSVHGNLNNGCPVIDSHFIADSYCEEVIFNVISPNGDGTNDFIDPKEMMYYACYVIIYNRWGNEVFNLRSNNLIWNGQNSTGDPLSESTYF